MHSFYNPYSIVKELPIAKTGAELDRFRSCSPLILAVSFCGVIDGAIRLSLKAISWAWWS